MKVMVAFLCCHLNKLGDGIINYGTNTYFIIFKNYKFLNYIILNYK